MGKKNALPKDIGTIGETVAAEYLRRMGFTILQRNVSRKTGELDIVSQKNSSLHIIEVKAVQCHEFSTDTHVPGYNPADNLHANKLRKIIRTSEWYVAETGWEGEWQIDAILVWLRISDGMAHVSYYPQIV